MKLTPNLEPCTAFQIRGHQRLLIFRLERSMRWAIPTRKWFLYTYVEVSTRLATLRLLNSNYFVIPKTSPRRQMDARNPSSKCKLEGVRPGVESTITLVTEKGGKEIKAKGGGAKRGLRREKLLCRRRCSPGPMRRVGLVDGSSSTISYVLLTNGSSERWRRKPSFAASILPPRSEELRSKRRRVGTGIRDRRIAPPKK